VIKRFTDHAANERTFLSWLRLAIGVMAFGFVIEKFEIYLAYLGHMTGHLENIIPSTAAKMAGIVMMSLALVIIVVATIRFVKYERQIQSEEEFSFRSMFFNIFLSVLILAVLIFIMGYIGHQVFSVVV
jgi:putative membrane protein